MYIFVAANIRYIIFKNINLNEIRHRVSKFNETNSPKMHHNKIFSTLFNWDFLFGAIFRSIPLYIGQEGVTLAFDSCSTHSMLYGKYLTIIKS